MQAALACIIRLCVYMVVNKPAAVEEGVEAAVAGGKKEAGGSRGYRRVAFTGTTRVHYNRQSLYSSYILVH